MNWDRIEGNWKQARGKAKEQWGRLTDDDLDVIAGKQDQLIGRVQEAYGLASEEAAREVHEWGQAVERALESQKVRAARAARAAKH